MIESINIKPLVIQEGRRYVMRYGGITGVITKNGSGFTDTMFRWFNDGRYYADRENGRDLIAEHIPQPEPLPFVLKAGGKYELDNGEVIELYVTQWTAKGLRAHFPLQFHGRGIFYVTADGVCVHDGTEEVRRIVREHVPQLTNAEKLESALVLIGTMSRKTEDEAMSLIRGVIADLKAAVKP